MIRYSFIIPVKEINAYVREAVPTILQIPGDHYEIIVYPDYSTDERWSKTRQISSGPGGPAMKRDLALRDAKGDVCIFLDDDAYPETNYLDILDRDFADDTIAAVGGPAVTPRGDSFWQKVSGAVYLSRWSGGYPERYTPTGRKKFVDDWPSVNLAVRKTTFAAVGGFQTEYWPGEDTKFCLDLITKTKGKILYDPELIAYHHRREGLRRHLRQAGRYGLHRGFFAKKFPRTSLRVKYFIPTLFVAAAAGGAFVSLFRPALAPWYSLFWIIYAVSLVLSSFDIMRVERSVSVALCALPYIFFTHLTYGLRFAQGFFFTRQLRSRTR